MKKLFILSALVFGSVVASHAQALTGTLNGVLNPVVGNLNAPVVTSTVVNLTNPSNGGLTVISGTSGLVNTATSNVARLNTYAVVNTLSNNPTVANLNVSNTQVLGNNVTNNTTVVTNLLNNTSGAKYISATAPTTVTGGLANVGVTPSVAVIINR